MSHIPYPFEQVEPTRYKFFSVGRNRIEKIVDFVPLKVKNVMNLGFGDLSPDGSIDDRVASNNGDIGKVLATIVMILKHFTALQPHIIIYFSGSTVERTRLYTRVLKMYYSAFSKEFMIYGIVGTKQNGQRLPFDPCAQVDYFAFLIKRINY
jgi:uncharacterized protein DUF6934